MKTLIRLYKMFYRLLRLKDWQRKEIERKAVRDFLVRQMQDRIEHLNHEVELSAWHRLAMRYGCNLPQELQSVITDIQVTTMNEVVKDFTDWNDCDVNTENPGEKYYRCHYGWVLVKMQNRVDDKEYDIPAVAKFNKFSHLWAFSIIAEREMVRDLKVVKWRPIH